MQVSVSQTIAAPAETIWQAITNIDNCDQMITAIKSIEVLERPEEGVVGLKWQETREMFGKDATETMWITEAKAPSYYHTRAESHGSVYISTMAIEEQDGSCELSMSFKGEPQTFGAKILMFLMGAMVKKSMIKAIEQDLIDIKTFVEASK
ncbi:SRPBCC family protein [Thalassotalea agarivorans]|uniref:Carbon monoxide dehydrogenase subunit G n=1 Tax=Thalassotalea agarivorans TaxID=349064 RepID=A0A1I0AG64_THASX|nr:SRPBCC family protein [Thalassotalea agarivorans]SES92817.1 Carbon monoxide dehydrogenase subunit G [Thalassotalea agarivorans]